MKSAEKQKVTLLAACYSILVLYLLFALSQPANLEHPVLFQFFSR